MMWIPKLTRHEIANRALSLVGTPASMPARDGVLDCLDLVVYAYDYPDIEKDISRWPDMLGVIRALTGWYTRGADEDPQVGDLATFWIKGPHVGVFIDSRQIVQAGSREIKVGQWARWIRYGRGVLTWQ